MFQWYYLVLVSAVLMGLSTIIEKRTLRSEHASAYSASFALLVATISFVLFVPFLKLDISLEDWVLIYMVSLLTTATYLIAARVFRHGSISVASPLNSVLPIFFVVVFSYVFLGEAISIAQYAGIAVTLAATYLLLMKSGKKDFERVKYKYLIVVSAVISGASAMLFKYLLSTTTPITYMVLTQVFMAMNLAVYMTIRYGGVKEIAHNTLAYKKELLAVAALTIGYRICYYFAVSQVQISLASPLRNSIYIMMVVISGPMIFKEGKALNKVLFSIMLLVGAFMIIL